MALASLDGVAEGNLSQISLLWIQTRHRIPLGRRYHRVTFGATSRRGTLGKRREASAEASLAS